jgi:hypothetical protein
MMLIKENGVDVGQMTDGSVTDVDSLKCGQVTGISYLGAAAGNRMSLGGITRNAVGARIGLMWSFAPGAAVTGAIARSPSGRAVQNTFIGIAQGLDVNSKGCL